MICWFSYCCCTLNRPNETREIMDVIQKVPEKVFEQTNANTSLTLWLCFNTTHNILRCWREYCKTFELENEKNLSRVQVFQPTWADCG